MFARSRPDPPDPPGGAWGDGNIPMAPQSYGRRCILRRYGNDFKGDAPGNPCFHMLSSRKFNSSQACRYLESGWIWIPSGEHTKSNGKSQFVMGKSTISMAIFNSFLLVHQRVISSHLCLRSWHPSNGKTNSSLKTLFKILALKIPNTFPKKWSLEHPTIKILKKHTLW